jgi:protein required for attachment to host cells
MKPIRTWVVIADAARAKIYVNEGPGRGLALVPDSEVEAELPASHDIGSDRPGVGFSSADGRRHGIEPKSDPHRILKARFANSLAEDLDRRLAEGSFDRLVLVAPPAFLGDLRQALSDRLRQVIEAEIAKDLTKMPEAELHEHLADTIRI